MYQSLSWECARGHIFSGKVYPIIKAGHWCPVCVPPPWDFDQEARLNPFFAQVWYPWLIVGVLIDFGLFLVLILNMWPV